MSENRTPPVEAPALGGPLAPIPDFALQGLTVADLNAMMEGLGEIPHKRAMPVVKKIQDQINAYNLALAKAQEAAANVPAVNDPDC